MAAPVEDCSAETHLRIKAQENTASQEKKVNRGPFCTNNPGWVSFEPLSSCSSSLQELHESQAPQPAHPDHARWGAKSSKLQHDLCFGHHRGKKWKSSSTHGNTVYVFRERNIFFPTALIPNFIFKKSEKVHSVFSYTSLNWNKYEPMLQKKKKFLYVCTHTDTHVWIDISSKWRSFFTRRLVQLWNSYTKK